MLEILDRFCARASFFLVGAKAARHPELVRAIVERGHDIGNHTFGHSHAWLLSPAQIRGEIERTDDLLTRIAGRPPVFFRPPWGAFNLATYWWLRRSRRPVVLWSVIGYDWVASLPAAYLVRRILARVRGGSVVLLHDGRGYPGTPQRLVEALPLLLEELVRRGFRPAPLRELVALPRPGC